MTIGPLKKYFTHKALNKKVSRKKKSTNTVYRDYRGTKGAVDDAEGVKK